MRKPGFRQKVKLQHQGGNEFKTLNRLVFYSERFEREFIAPEGLITDLASIPWFAQSFCQVLGNNIRSAILHDFNCRPEGKITNKVTQKEADQLFHEGMSLDHVRWSKARIMYFMVRGFQRVKYLFKRGESYG